MKKLISLVAFGYMLCSVFIVDSVDAKKRRKSPPPRAEVAENSPEGYSDGEEEQFERKPVKNKAWRKKFKNKIRRRNNDEFEDNRNSAEEYSNETEEQFDQQPTRKKAPRKKFRNRFQDKNYQREDEVQQPKKRKKGKKFYNQISHDDSGFEQDERKPLSKKQLKKMRKKGRKKEGIVPNSEVDRENFATQSDDWKNEIAAKTLNTIEPVVDSKKINNSSVAVVSNKVMNKISAQPVLAQNSAAPVNKPNTNSIQESIKTRLAKLSDFHKSCNLIRDPKPVVQLYSGTKEFREDLDRYRTILSEKVRA